MGAEISILIPVKNEEAFIQECLRSIQEQTFDDWEAWVIDDHSTDDTFDIVEGFSRKDPRVRVVKNEGKGIIQALRTAYQRSSGKFITRMDGDDIMRPKKLEILRNLLLDRGEQHVAVGGVHYFSAERVKSGFRNYEYWLNEKTAEGTNFQDIFKECSIPSPNWMLYRKDLDSIGAFDSDRYPEDYDLAFRMFLGGLSVIPCSEITLDWRDYPQRTSRTSTVYQDHTFTEIKWYYFQQYFRNPAKRLVLFGTGFRGKKLARHLIDKKVEFEWVSHNKEKIGKHIYDVLIKSLDAFNWKGAQIIATIAKDKGREEVNTMARKNGLEINKDLIHFA